MGKKFLYMLMFFLCVVNATAQRLAAIHLLCEWKKDPLGIEAIQPRLNWQLQSTKKNVLQQAYRILVSDNAALLANNVGNMWDSDKIISTSSIMVPYAGKPLMASKKYFWKVMVWDNQNSISAWSAIAQWQMGLPTLADWKNARWIGYEKIADTAIIAPHVHLNGKKAWGTRRNVLPLMRRTFTIDKKIKQATIFIAGLGHFQLSINGQKVSDDFLAPGWTNYDKHAQYVSYDVTPHLRSGNNAMGVMLGNGFYYIPSQRYRKMTGAYGLPVMIAQLLIEYEDGSSASILTDEQWKTAPSPIIYSSIFGGEDYDASLYQPNWDTNEFNDSHWKNAVLSNGPALLQAQIEEPVKIMQRLFSKNRISLSKSSFVYDLGQNFSGVPEIKVKGNKGDTIKLFAGELLHSDGTVNQKATGSPSYFTYILAGNGTEEWHPIFSYTGFRYVQVQSIASNPQNKLPEIISVQGLHIRNSAATKGSFTSSNTLFNQTHALINWAIKSNMMSVFTDCPHREKLGWLEQTQLMGASVHFNYDIAALNRKVVNDMKFAQYQNGKIPEIAPEYTVFTAPFDESPEWGSASIILPWYQFKWYADTVSLRNAYQMMRNYTLYLKSKSINYLLTHGLGDWYDIGPKKSGFSQMTQMGITATATYYYDLNIIKNVANLLQKKEDAKMFEVMADSVKSAFNQQYFNPQLLQYDSASQTANAMALYMGLVEEQYVKNVEAALVKDIRSRNNALTAGDIGFRYVLKALQQAGRNDIIFDMNSRNDVPGYGFQIKNGATALTESWQAYESVSNNHFMLGHLMEWFYAGLAGINQTNNSIGYKEVLINPAMVGDVQFVKASFESPYGIIQSQWKRNGNKVNMLLRIPANSTALVQLPSVPVGKVRVNKKSQLIQYNKQQAFLKLGSGTYQIKYQQSL